jgi:hypothetical protein|tara:strand:- start:341 stop:613 length:273 start_codon:yes stop_codon:yes gene_type:complete
MTQYDDVIEKQRIKAAAEEWGKNIKEIHAFNSDNTNVWYDSRKGDGRVIDTSYNSGLIKREIISTGKTVYIGKRDRDETLIDRFRRYRAK